MAAHTQLASAPVSLCDRVLYSLLGFLERSSCSLFIFLWVYSLTRKLCLNLDLWRPLPSLLRLVLPLPPPAALVSVASQSQGTSSSSVSVPSTANSETCRAALLGESHAVGVDPNSALLFKEFLAFMKTHESVSLPSSVPSSAPLLLASAPPPTASLNPPTVTLGGPAVDPHRDSRPTQPLAGANFPARLHYAGVYQRGDSEGRSQPTPYGSALGGGFGFGALRWKFY